MALYARMSFNNNGWITPSGKDGKSPNAGNHEHDYGFGFEEWFFNPRRFKSKNEGDKIHHYAYIEPLSDFDPLIQKEDDLVLYTIKWDGNVCSRYIVLRLKKDEWRFIEREEYLSLKEINNVSILEMRIELADTMPILCAGLVIKRFNQQKEGSDFSGNDSNEHRLWNIEILKKVEPLMEKVSQDTPCPDWHINTFRMFRLYDSERGKFNHENCGSNF